MLDLRDTLRFKKVYNDLRKKSTDEIKEFVQSNRPKDIRNQINYHLSCTRQIDHIAAEIILEERSYFMQL